MATYYVRKSGNNANPGTSGSPRLTIASGLSLLTAAGDELVVGDGTYNEAITLGAGGSLGNPKILRAENPRGVLLRPGTNNGFTAVSRSHWTIDGFDVTTTGDTHCLEFDACWGITIRRCYMHDCNNSGISLVECEFATIEDNECANCAQGSWYSGISMYQARNVSGDTTTTGFRNIIRRNVCYGAFQSAGPFTDGNGIIIDDFRHTQNGSTFGVYPYPTLVENNICFNNGGKGIQVFDSNFVTVRNNFVYGNNTDTKNTGTFRGDLSNQDGSDNVFANNISICERVGKANVGDSLGTFSITNNNRALANYTADNSNTNTVFRNNLSYDLTSTGSSSIDVQGAGSENITSGANGNLLATNPLVVALSRTWASADFRLQSGSPAINAGTNAYGLPSTDILGNPRVSGAAVDIGAYEFGASAAGGSMSRPVLAGGRLVLRGGRMLTAADAVIANGIADAIQPGRLGMSTPDGELAGAGLAAEIADYVSMGVAMARYDFAKSIIRPTQSGAFDWTRHDTLVPAVSGAGIKTLAVMAPGGNMDYSFDTSGKRAEFATYCADVLTRYPQIGFVEIGNEVNKDNRTTPANFAALMQVVYPAIKAVRGSIQVGIMGLSGVQTTGGTDISVIDYLTGFMSAGGAAFFDFLGLHAYAPNLRWLEPGNPAWHSRQRIDEARSILNANGGTNKLIWMTEIGGDTGGTNYTPHTQASLERFVGEVVADLQARDDVGPILWYSYQDRNSAEPVNNESHFGLIRSTGLKKFAYEVYKARALADGSTTRSFRKNSGSYTIPLKRLFTAPGDPRRSSLSISVSGMPSGVTLSAGVLTIDTATASIQAGTALTVTATRSGGGSASLVLTLNITNPEQVANAAVTSATGWWVTNTGATITYDSAEDALLLNATTSYIGALLTETLTLTVGVTYQIRAWVKAGTYTGGVNLGVEGNKVDVGALTGEYREVTRTFVAASASPYLYIDQTSPATGTFWIKSYSIIAV